MASGSVPARLLEWYEENRSGSASSRSGGARNAALERMERAVRSGGSVSRSQAMSSVYGDLPF